MHYLLLFMFALNFMHQANFLSIILFALVLGKDTWKVKVMHGATFSYLLIGSIIYCILYTYNYGSPSSTTFMLRFVVPLVMFYIGYSRGTNGLACLKKDVIVIAFAGFLHGMLNILNNRDLDILSVSGRQYQDVWGGAINGTLQNLFFVVPSGLLCYFLVCEKDKKLKIVGIIASLGGVAGSIVNASRTMIFITIIVFFISLLVYMHLQYGFGNAVLRSIAVGLLILLILTFTLWLDLFDFQKWFLTTALGQRQAMSKANSSILDNVRWTYAKEIMTLLPSNPFGGISYHNYAHNLWLDIAKESGIITFILYLLFSIRGIGSCISVLKKDRRIENILLFFPVILAYMLAFFTEPVMQGSPITFAQFCFLIGGLTAYQYCGGKKSYNVNSIS